MTRVYLSPPDVGAEERQLLLEALDSGWIAPLGPHVDMFEDELARRVGVPHAVAMSSGTAALHLALLLVGVGPGDDVLMPTFTFVATANAATYIGARTVLVDCDVDTWQLAPDLVAQELQDRARRGALPKAVVAVDLYGQTVDYGRLVPVCEEYGVALVEDAAEALGASHRGQAAGSFGAAGVFSFNGNKIITTSGGGMFVSRHKALADRARHLATQAREPEVHYEHVDLGFNYRMSNLLAALGVAQLRGLDRRVERRRAINRAYRDALVTIGGDQFHATRLLRRAEQLAHMHPRRSRRIRGHARRAAPGTGNPRHRGTTHLEAAAPPAAAGRGAGGGRKRGGGRSSSGDCVFRAVHLSPMAISSVSWLSSSVSPPRA